MINRSSTRIDIRKLFMSFLIFFIIMSALVVGVAYHVVIKISRRYMQPSRWQEMIKESYKYLVQDLCAKTVTFFTDDHLALTGLLITRPKAKRNILMCHGYGMTKEYMRPYVDMFPNDNILIFDFRAQGESEGDTISIGFHEKKDVHAALNFLQNNPATSNKIIVALGVSMGAAALLSAVSERPAEVKALVLDSTFARLFDQLCQSFARRTGLPIMPFFKITMIIFEYLASCRVAEVTPGEFVKKITCPIFIIHSEDDQVTRVDNAKELYQRASTVCYLWLVKKI